MRTEHPNKSTTFGRAPACQRVRVQPQLPLVYLPGILLLLCDVFYAGDTFVVSEHNAASAFVEPTSDAEAAPGVESPTGYAPKLLWTPERQAIYNRMVAEKHPLWLLVKANADKAVAGRPDYGDSGQYATLAFQATGDEAYGKAAVAQLTEAMSIDPSANTIRESGLEYALCLEWLRPAATDEEFAACLAHLDRWCLKALGVNQLKYDGGFSDSDSDQLTGQYFMLAAADRAFGRDYLSRTTESVAAKKYSVGGLTPTGTGTIRDTLASYAAMSDGGVWIESSPYNMGTLSFTVLGVEAVGREFFPEFVALYDDFANAQLAEITPDLKDSFQWGDEEHPHGFEGRLFKRLNLLWMLTGVTQGNTANDVRGMIAALGEKYPDREPWWRAFWLADPYGGSSPPPQTRAVNGSVGVYLRKTPDELFGVTFPIDTGVHHTLNLYRFGDFRLYRDGEWAINSPIGYGGVANYPEAGNCVLLAGLGPMADRWTWAEDEKFIGETGGPFYAPGYYDPPPAFVRRYRREISRDGISVVLRDMIDMDDPRKLPKFDRYRDKPPNHKAMILAAGDDLVQLVFHCPVQPTVEPQAVSWQTANGQTVRIVWEGDRTVKVIDEKQLWSGVRNISESERKWQVRLVPVGYTGGAVELVTRVEVGQ